MQIVMKNQAKKDLIRKVAEVWIRKDPAMAKEMATMLKETTAAEINKGWNRKKDVQVSVRVPQELYLVLKFFIKDFGEDPKDIKLLAEEFPDLVTCRK